MINPFEQPSRSNFTQEVRSLVAGLDVGASIVMDVKDRSRAKLSGTLSNLNDGKKYSTKSCIEEQYKGRYIWIKRIA